MVTSSGFIRVETFWASSFFGSDENSAENFETISAVNSEHEKIWLFYPQTWD